MNSFIVKPAAVTLYIIRSAECEDLMPYQRLVYSTIHSDFQYSYNSVVVTPVIAFIPAPFTKDEKVYIGVRVKSVKSEDIILVTELREVDSEE